MSKKKNRPNPQVRARIEKERRAAYDKANNEPDTPAIVETSRDMTLIEELLKVPDWEIPEAASKRVPGELYAMALGKNRNGMDDPAIEINHRLRAIQTLDSLSRSNLSKRVQAIKQLQQREQIDKGVVINPASNVHVVLYLPERGKEEDFMYVEEEQKRIVDDTHVSGNGNGKAKKETT